MKSLLPLAALVAIPLASCESECRYQSIDAFLSSPAQIQLILVAAHPSASALEALPNGLGVMTIRYKTPFNSSEQTLQVRLDLSIDGQRIKEVNIVDSDATTFAAAEIFKFMMIEVPAIQKQPELSQAGQLPIRELLRQVLNQRFHDFAEIYCGRQHGINRDF